MKKVNTTVWQRLLLLATMIYGLFCIYMYFAQDRMLFPTHVAMPVSRNWLPTAGILQQNTFLAGQCGKLHAVRWQVANEKGTVMIFHGNAESVASVENQVPMFHAQGFSVMTWDYAGYGQSDECWSSERIILRDAETAYTWLSSQTILPIVIYGRSIGSGPAIYIASKFPVQKLLLASPYDSLTNVASENMPFFVPVRLIMRFPFDSRDWIHEVKAPIYAIHGLADTLINPSRAVALFARAKQPVKVFWVKELGHNIYSANQFEPWLANSLK